MRKRRWHGHRKIIIGSFALIAAPILFYITALQGRTVKGAIVASVQAAVGVWLLARGIQRIRIAEIDGQ
jgi:hypothetical protein